MHFHRCEEGVAPGFAARRHVSVVYFATVWRPISEAIGSVFL